MITRLQNRERRLSPVIHFSALLIVLINCLVIARPTAATTSSDIGLTALETQPIEDATGSAMRPFYDSLIRTASGHPSTITRIVHYGDSHVAAGILTGELRRRYQLRFGNAGAGFFLPSPSGQSPQGVASTASSGWRIQGLGRVSPEQKQLLGLAGLSLSTDRADEWIRVESRCSRFEVYLLREVDAGSVQITLDGGLYQREVSLAAESPEPGYIRVEAGDEGVHVLEVRTVRAGLVRVLGVVAERGRQGVTCAALGINGARATRPLEWDWKVLSANLEHYAPNLIIIAYGSNEAGDSDLDVAAYSRRLLALLQRFHKAFPGASLLVTSPPDRAIMRNGRWQSIDRMRALVAAQRRAAVAGGAAFWDLFSAMGGSGSIDRWATRSQPLAQADRVHLTANGYKLVADRLHCELMRGYLWRLLGGGVRPREKGEGRA